jgi:PEP-CTERM motif
MVFGAAIVGANYATDGGGASHTYSATSTFDFGYGGDLMLGLIDDQLTGFAGGLGFQSLEFIILDNGIEILNFNFKNLAVAESFFHDSVINLGSNLGPDIDLTFAYNLVADGSGGFGFDFALGGAVPEPSTWAMMLLGFAGLGFAGYRAHCAPRLGPGIVSSRGRSAFLLRHSRRHLSVLSWWVAVGWLALLTFSPQADRKRGPNKQI